MNTRTFLKSLAATLLSPLIDLRGLASQKPDPKPISVSVVGYREVLERFEVIWEWIDIEICHCLPDGTCRKDKQRVLCQRPNAYRDAFENLKVEFVCTTCGFEWTWPAAQISRPDPSCPKCDRIHSCRLIR